VSVAVVDFILNSVPFIKHSKVRRDDKGLCL